MANYITTSKISKNKSTYSTVIPAPIKNKLALEQKQVLYWDIDDDKIIITPETKTIGNESQTAGNEILKDIIFNNKGQYTQISKEILGYLNNNSLTKERKIKRITAHKLKLTPSFKLVIVYLLGCDLTPENKEILKEIYDEIHQTD